MKRDRDCIATAGGAWLRTMVTKQPRRVAPWAFLLATLGLASCAGPDKTAPRGAVAASYRAIITSDPVSLDRLEKAARKCRLKNIRREGPDNWLTFDTPAEAPGRGDPFLCFLQWAQDHPETPYFFVGNEAR